MSHFQVKAASGVKWTSFSAIVITIVQFAKLPIIARLLKPEDFGLMAMVTVVIGFAHAFADMGISNAIIHRQDANDNELSSLYWLNIFAGIVIFALIIIVSPLIVSFYNQPRLRVLIFLAAFNFLIIPIGQQFQVLYQKELKFEQLAKIEVVTTITSSIIAITTAYLGQGVFALIWGQLSHSICKSTLLVKLDWTNWHPKLHFRNADLTNYLQFGIYQLGERSINYFSANIDYLVIGRFLSPETLGVYTFAYQLVTMPLARINPILTKVAFPIFAKKQNDNAALSQGYLSMIKLLALIALPVQVLLAVSSPIVIPTIFGSQWISAVPLIQILTIVGILKTIGNPSGSVILAKGKVDLSFKWNIFVAIINLLFFIMVVPFGLPYIAWSYAILSSIYFIIGFKLLINQTIYVNYQDLLVSLKYPLLFSSVMGFLIHLISKYLVILDADKVFLSIIIVVLGMFIYCILWLLFDFKYFQYLYKVIQAK